MLKYTQVSGFGHVDGPNGVRHWAQFMLIDREADTGVRQIRGFTYGGIGVFTYWIKQDSTIEVQSHAGGRVVMIGHDGKHLNMDQGVLVKAQNPDGSDLVLGLSPENYREPSIKFEDIDVECAPHGAEIDKKILESYVAPGYPLVIWAVPKGQVLSTLKQLGAALLGRR